MSRTEKLIKNTVLYFVASFASKLLTIVLVPIYVAYLDADDFGEANLLLLLSGLFGVIYTFDAVDASYRFLLDETENQKNIVSSALCLYFLGTVAFIVLFFCVFYFRFKFIYCILCAHIVITNFQALIQQIARGLKFNREFAQAGVLMSFLQGILNILMIVGMKIGGVSILLAPIIASFATSLYLLYSTKLLSLFKIVSINFRVIEKMIRYGFPLCIGVLLNWILLNSGTYILAWVTDTTSYSGVFAVAIKISSVIYMVMSIFNVAWQETAISESNKSDYTTYCNKIFNHYIILVIYGICFLMILFFYYFNFINTKDYTLVKNLVPVLLIGNLFYSLQHYLLTNFYVSMKTKAVMRISFVCGMLALCVGLVLVPLFTIFGLTATVVLSQFSLFTFTYLVVTKTSSYHVIFDKDKLLAIILLMITLTCYYIGNKNLFYFASLIIPAFIMYQKSNTLYKVLCKISLLIKSSN